jgi:hypothetical protein
MLVAARVQRCKKVLIVGAPRLRAQPEDRSPRTPRRLDLRRSRAVPRPRPRGFPTSENGAVAASRQLPSESRHAMSDDPAAVQFPHGTNQKHLRFGAKQVRLEHPNATLVANDGDLHGLKCLLLLPFQNKPLRESPGKGQDENCCAQYEAIHSSDRGSFILRVALQVRSQQRRLTSSDNNKLASVGRLLDACPQSKANNAFALGGAAMRETEGQVKIAAPRENFGTVRTTKRPITWSMTGKAAP